MIRAYSEADAPRCCEIINACLPQMSDMNEAARAYVRNKNIPAILHNEFINGYPICYEINGIVQGFGLFADNKIKRVYVDPLMRSHGIGHALMQALEQEACRRGLVEVRLQSRPDAVDFYLALGYGILSRESLVSGEAQYEIVTMSKSLKPLHRRRATIQ